MTKSITVRNRKEAWEVAAGILRDSYTLVPDSVERAGYPIYRSDVEYYDYICDLNIRLEVNLSTNLTINVWIDEPEHTCGITLDTEEV